MVRDMEINLEIMDPLVYSVHTVFVNFDHQKPSAPVLIRDPIRRVTFI
jgi:hypothetical protein